MDAGSKLIWVENCGQTASSNEMVAIEYWQLTEIRQRFIRRYHRRYRTTYPLAATIHTQQTDGRQLVPYARPLVWPAKNRNLQIISVRSSCPTLCRWVRDTWVAVVEAVVCLLLDQHWVACCVWRSWLTPSWRHRAGAPCSWPGTTTCRTGSKQVSYTDIHVYNVCRA